MSYLVLARKYRPQTFSEVVEQSHITKTLSHAIAANRVAHALLFTGPRGTGKTTVARIVAKALNCQEGPTPTPCNKCPSCTEITNGNAADVFEIDGASNNSVEQIRELRENIPYMPSRSRYKIYIIDEVHMLSIAAFNALLKTLEEPPAHILFLFATTEPQKIPITILSRCQRHDMRRISTSAISEHLATLCQKEGFDLPEEVLTTVAREAGGSMRDALSLLDQILSCSDGKIDFNQVLGLFGVINRKAVFDLADAILNGRMTDILDVLDNVYQHGQDLRRFYTEILNHFRNLLIVKIGHNVDKLVDLPYQEIQLLKEQATAFSVSALSQIFDFLFKQEQSVRIAAQAKLALEMIFLRLLQVRPALSIDELILKLDALKKGLPDLPAAFCQKNIDSNLAGNLALKKEINAPDNQGNLKETVVRETAKVEKELAVKESKNLSPKGSNDIAPDQDKAALTRNEIRQEKKNNSSPDTRYPVKKDDLWKHLIAFVQKNKPSLASVLTNCNPPEICGDCLSLEIDDSGYAIKVLKKNLPQLNQWCQKLSGGPMNVKLSTKSESKIGKQDEKQLNSNLKNEALSHPIILEAIEVFHGKVAEVKILSGGKKL